MRSIRSVLFLFVVLQSLNAQTPATGSIRGIVLRWGTTEPVGQATIELRGGSATGASPLAITASQDTGEFIFTNVPAGTYRIFAMAPGFASAEYGQLRPNGAGRPITINSGQQASLKIGMMRGGVISGRIADLNGEPVVYSPVQILKVTYSAEGWLAPTLMLSVTTNDLGEYRAFGLPPGQYLVNAGPAQLSTFANHGMTNPANSDTSIPTTFVVQTTRPRASPPPEDEATAGLGFASTLYYPGTADVRSAEIVNLPAGGEVTRIDIRLSSSFPANNVRLAGRVVDPSGQPVQGGFSLSINNWPDAIPLPLARVSLATTRVPATDPEQRARGAEVYVPDNGRFYGAAAPGLFQIRASQSEFSGRAVIDVGNRDLDLVVPLRPSTSVAGQVRVENIANGTVTLNGLQVAIRTAPATQFTAPVASDGTFRIERVIVGDYRVYVPPLVANPAPQSTTTLPPVLQNAYVKAIRAGGADLMDSLLRLEGVDPSAPIEIVLSLQGASIIGRVLNMRQEPVSQATVVLLPEGQPPFRPDRQKTFTTGENGRFEFRGLPPGEYRLFAWEDVDPGAWFSPSFLRSYEGSATPVRLIEGQSQELAVPLIPFTP